MKDSLVPVRRASAKHTAARAQLDDSIRAARADGKTLRSIAEAAQLSHEWVRHICEGNNK